MSRAVRIQHGAFGRIALLDLDRSLVVHAHPQCHMLVHLQGPPASFGIRDTVVPLNSTESVLVSSWAPHHYPHAHAHQRCTILAFYLEPDWLQGFTGPGDGFTASGSLPVTPAMRCWVGALHTELLREEGSDPLQIEQAMRMLVLDVAVTRTAPGACLPALTEERLDRRLRKALEIMRANLGERLNFDLLAGASGLSRPHFFEMFKRELQLTPGVCWNMLRMESALRQLGQRSLPVGVVASNLGFTAQANFTRFFRDIQGIAPREYRSVLDPRREPDPPPMDARLRQVHLQTL